MMKTLNTIYKIKKKFRKEGSRLEVLGFKEGHSGEFLGFSFGLMYSRLGVGEVVIWNGQ